MTENKRKCKYCKHLLINLIGTSQTCTKLNTIIPMDDNACADFEFSEKKYNQIQRYLNEEARGKIH